MAEIDLSEYRDMSTRLKTASRSLKTRMNKRLRDQCRRHLAGAGWSLAPQGRGAASADRRHWPCASPRLRPVSAGVSDQAREACRSDGNHVGVGLAPGAVVGREDRARGRGTAAFLDQKEKIQAALGDEVGKIVRELQ